MRADWFVRGDADGSGKASISDAVGVLRYLFLGDAEAPACLKAADANGDGKVMLDDAVVLLEYLFLGWEPPTLPFPGCGTDFAAAGLGCESSPPCESLCVVFCLDRSGGMNESHKFTRLKQLVTKGIADLPATAEFAVVFFDVSLDRFPRDGTPVMASGVKKATATAYILAMQTGHGGCEKLALLAALDTAAQSAAASKVIVHISDGINGCPGYNDAQYDQETLAKVSARNAGAVRIDTVGVGSAGLVNEDFLRALASSNGGTFTRVLE
jgi:hypothetical protein